MLKASWMVLFSTLMAAAAVQGAQLPTADEVVARMMDRDAQRQSTLHGYSGLRHYVLENEHRHKRAEMTVRINCREDGLKKFDTVSESGWSVALHHVFPRLLDGEREASLPGARDRSRVSPENYVFQMAETENVNGRPAYVMSIAPKTDSSYLIEGRIWVDAEDYAIVRIEGKPSKNPSFWIRSVQFVHTYRKEGPLWIPESDHSVTDARILGRTQLTIDYTEFSPNEAAYTASRTPLASGASRD